MPSFRTSRRVRHEPQQMFDLVADVERYPEFVPLCRALRVIGQERSGEERGQAEAYRCTHRVEAHDPV